MSKLLDDHDREKQLMTSLPIQAILDRESPSDDHEHKHHDQPFLGKIFFLRFHEIVDDEYFHETTFDLVALLHDNHHDK